MEKTLKRLLLLIPILIIAFPLKNVYADEPIDIYFSTRYGSFRWNSYDTYERKYFDFKAFDNNFNFNMYYAMSYKKAYFVLYDTQNNIYSINIITLSNNKCPNIGSLSINILNNSIQCNVNDNWVDSNPDSYYNGLLSISNVKNYLNNIYNNTRSEMFINDDYYLTYNISTNNYINYIYNNVSNFQLVYISEGDKLFINSVELKNVPEPEPEPEPETPSVPPYIFNNTKYYVPNYDERNCVEIIDKDTIRVFENEETLNYTDYYINSNYISKKGQVEVSYVKNCSNLQFTNIRYYGNDFPQILFITLVVITFSVGFPYILYKRFRKR